MCLYPKQIKNKRYTKTKKNGGIIPAVTDIRTKTIDVPCGNCIICRKKKAREWKIRLIEDLIQNNNAIFVTLTFSDESIKTLTDDVNNYILVEGKRVKTKRNLQGYILDNTIATRALRLFNERWRKQYKKAIRHWLVTELGHNGTENIHLHGIVWTDKTKIEAYKAIQKHWKFGHIWPNREEHINKTYVNNKTIGYITKYVNKKDTKHPSYNSIVLTSSGIGANYITSPSSKLNKYKNEATLDHYKAPDGTKLPLPAYYRRKIYNDDQRETLWINSLNKGEKHLLGDIITNGLTEQEKNEVYNFHRKNNQKLGYGSDKKDQEKMEKERQERIQKQKIRYAKAEKKMPAGGG